MKFEKRLKIVNLGLDLFTEAFRNTGTPYTTVDWKPSPSDSDPELAARISALAASKKVQKANAEAFKRLNDSQPVLTAVKQAKDVVPGIGEKKIFYAGPPVDWENMCGPVKGAVMGACIYEGWAETAEEAEKMCETGDIEFSPCHHHDAVGPMAGILSPSMYVWVVKNRTYGNTAYCSLNEGLGKVLRFGAYSADVIERLKWMQDVLGPRLEEAVDSAGEPLNIANITSQALHMGDECHNRNVAATGILLKELTNLLLKTSASKSDILEITEFIGSNPHFFLNISMAACKSTADALKGISASTIVYAMARNGTEIGIRVCGCGEKWYTAQAGIPKGLFFPGYTQDDANLDLGDSTISEIAGIGGFAMASAPAIVKFVGGTPGDAIRYTQEMTHITYGTSSRFTIPQMNFAGTPTGMDIVKIAETGISPFINTGIAHKEAGIGQVGAGILRAPMSLFTEALKDFPES